MGLDMYLSAEKYVSGFNHATDREKTEYETILSALNLQGFCCNGAPSLTVRVKVAYWRKANAIHRWFVQNCQDGKDECQETDVERDQLEALASLCEKVLASVETVEGEISTGTTHHADGRVEHHTERGQVLAQPRIAESLLPTQSGFFFGSTAYDQYYLEDLRSTVKQLRAVLDDPRFADFTFSYRSSW